MNIILDHALKLASTGKPVFPCRPDNKSPFVKGGFKAATTDADQIRAWWEKWPAAMIGMPTGLASGIWVLDIDAPKEGETGDGYSSLEEFVAKYGKFPPTRTHVTPGGGQHLLFEYPIEREIRSSASKIGSRLDIRGCGGYIIMPPSVNAAGKAYTVMDSSKAADAPGWLLDIVASLPKAKNDKPQMPQPHHNNGLTTYAQAAIAGELSTVVSASRGSRNDALNKAAFALGQWVGGSALPEQDAQIMLFQAAQSCGLVADDGERAVLKTIQSGVESGKKEPRHAPESSRNGDNRYNTTCQDIDEVEESESISAKHLPPPPPVPLEAFPPQIQEVLLEAAEAYQTPLQIPAACLLAFLATCVCGSRHVKLKESWAEPAAAWIGLVADSGTGKSPVANAFFRPIYDHEGEMIKEWEKLQAAYAQAHIEWEMDMKEWGRKGRKNGDPMPEESLKPHKRQCYLDDMTPEAMSRILSENPRGLSLLKDELSGFVAEMSRYSAKGDDGTRDRMLTAHQGGPWKISRIGRPDIYCRHALVGIFGTIQPGMLPRVFDAEKGGADEASGFLQRFILIRAERSKPKQWVETPFSLESRSLLDGIARHLLKWDVSYNESNRLIKNYVYASEAAKELYIGWFNKVAQEGFLSENPSLMDKLQASAQRICLQLHCLEAAIMGSDGMEMITDDTMRRTLLLADWIKENLFQCWSYFKPGTAKQVDPIARAIMQVLVDEAAAIEKDGWRILSKKLHNLACEKLNMSGLPKEKVGATASNLRLGRCYMDGSRARTVTPDLMESFKKAVIGVAGVVSLTATTDKATTHVAGEVLSPVVPPGSPAARHNTYNTCDAPPVALENVDTQGQTTPTTPTTGVLGKMDFNTAGPQWIPPEDHVQNNLPDEVLI